MTYLCRWVLPIILFLMAAIGLTAITVKLGSGEEIIAVQSQNTANRNTITVSGRIVYGYDNTLGVGNVLITLSGFRYASTSTNVTGYFSLSEVETGSNYILTATKNGFYETSVLFSTEEGDTDLDLGSNELNEQPVRPRFVTATQTQTGGYTLNWSAPFLAGTSLQYGIDTVIGGYTESYPPVPFKVAIRFTPEDLTPYVGTVLTAVSFFVYNTNVSYGVMVWTGGSQTSQGIPVSGHDYAYFTQEGWNQLPLGNPILITGEEEIRIGLLLQSEDMNVATANEGPLNNWKGNLVYYGGWTTANNLFSDMTGNWNIKGIIDYDRSLSYVDNERSFTGYKVWRLHEGQEEIPEQWTLLTPESIYEQTYSDLSPAPPMGYWTKKWAVEAIYTGNSYSPPAFSNLITGGAYQGLISGRVTNSITSQPVTGASIVFSPTHQYTYTDSNGEYEFLLAPGMYSLFMSVPNYWQYLQSDLMITNGNITTVNIALVPTTENQVSEPDITATELKGSYPNPFTDLTNISYNLKTPGYTSIDIYNIRGQLVKSLVKEALKTGNYTINWNGTDNDNKHVSDGMYFLRMTAGNYTASQNLILLK